MTASVLPEDSTPPILPAAIGYAAHMTDPNDDLSSVADPGSLEPDAMTEPADENTDAPPDDETRRTVPGRGVPGAAADSPAAQGSPVGPPD
jgi:hypothetical protein